MNPHIAALTSVVKSIRNVLFKKPLLAIYDTTKLCNQHCPMCNIRKDHSEHMNLAEIEETAKKLKRHGVGYVFIQGGEPLIRKDIIQIVDIFIKYSIKPTVITNGALLTKDLAMQIACRRCNLAISIDSLEPERYAYLRGSDDLAKVMQIIDKIADIKDRCGNWSITTTITRQSSFEDVKNIHAFAKEKGFMFAIRPYIAMTGNAGRKDENLVYSQEDVLAIFEHFLAIAKRENYLAYLVYREHIKYIKGEPTPPCDAMKYSFLLKENGDMAPCIEMPDKKFTFETFASDKRRYKPLIEQCNRTHPCFYNDAREIGILYRNVWRLLLNAPKIMMQMIRYKSFF
ncbi:MAG: radical SAM protein [Ruminococcaceae bacterium]|nr:radical SAM protein [Oscillospiraceae bacterium]